MTPNIHYRCEQSHVCIFYIIIQEGNNLISVLQLSHYVLSLHFLVVGWNTIASSLIATKLQLEGMWYSLNSQSYWESQKQIYLTRIIFINYQYFRKKDLKAYLTTFLKNQFSSSQAALSNQYCLTHKDKVFVASKMMFPAVPCYSWSSMVGVAD